MRPLTVGYFSTTKRNTGHGLFLPSSIRHPQPQSLSVASRKTLLGPYDQNLKLIEFMRVGGSTTTKLSNT